MRVSVLTLGCKANQAESSQIETGLRNQGYHIVDLTGEPDLCIINTCSVTSKSDYQSRQLIRRAERAGAKVIVTGCYSELNRDVVLSMAGVADVIGNVEKLRIIEKITGKTIDTALSSGINGKSRFFLKVQDGCNYSCSYCIISKARGRSRSVTLNEVIEQARSASESYNEIVLTGIHLGTYGYDLVPQVALADLVRDLLLKTSAQRIRLSSLEITEVSEELLELLEEKRVCDHLHIPLQSGDDKILQRMRRNYGSKRFLSGTEKIFKKRPDIAIGTDIIVGFPGEGEGEFGNTESVLSSLPFAYFHVFPFSRRPGTTAATMEMEIDADTKRGRCSRLIRLGKRKKREFMARQVGKILDPLIEETDGDGACIGTTGNYLKVRAFLDRPELRKIVDVRIVGHDEESLIGVPN